MSSTEATFLRAQRRWLSRDRLAAALLSLLMLLLMLAAIIAMGLLPGGQGRRDDHLATFNVRGDRQQAVKAKAMQQAKAAQRRAAADRESATRPEQSQPPAALPPGFLNLSREEYAAADISRMPHHSAAAAAASGGQPAAGPGEGPGGARLFDAEWVREPTKAELAPYFDGGWTTAGWATIACRTVDRFRVEDCRELDESPPGSGLARGLRQAAWQFLVRPPRIEGKALLGTWVRIRFEFSRSGSDEGR